MGELKKDYQHISEAQTHRQVSITVCTSAQESSVRGFMDELTFELDDTVKEVRYLKLPYNDIDKFSLKDKDIDVMILCHSIEARRFTITDVMDAIYTEFLQKAAKELDKENVGVIVHDFSTEKIMDDEQCDNEMESFRQRQPTTFKHASLVLISGQLGNSPAQLGPSNWTEIKEFVSRASAQPEEPLEKTSNKLLFSILVVLVFIAALAIALGLGLGYSNMETGPSTVSVTNLTTSTPTTINSFNNTTI